MNSFFRKLHWWRQRLKRNPNCARSFNSTWKRKRNTIKQKGWRRKKLNGRRRANWAIALWRRQPASRLGWTIVEQLGQDLRYAFRTMGLRTVCFFFPWRFLVAGDRDRSQHGYLSV